MNTTPPETGGTTTMPPRPHRRAPWSFRRREEGKWLAGVTTGMADAFGIDVVVVRVIWVIVTIASFGLGVAAYGICWLAFPSDESPAPIAELRGLHTRGAGYIVGIVLLAIGAIVVIGQLSDVRPVHHLGGLAWAALLIGGGIAVLVLRNRDDDDRDLPPAPVPPEQRPPEPGAEPWAASTEITDADTSDTEISDSEDATDTADAVDDIDDAPPPTADVPPIPPIPPTSSAWNQTAQWPTGPPPRIRRRRRPRRRPFITPITISLLLIGAGACALLDSTGSVHLTVAGVLASGLVLVGIAMVISAWYGRAHGLIPIGILLLLATIPAVSIDVPISGGVGERYYNPVTRTQLESHYELGIGHLDIDLLNVPLTDRITSVSAQLGVGELSVTVPTNVRVEVSTHTGAGHTELFGVNEGGWPHDDSAVAGPNQPGLLRLDLEVGAGSIIVHREARNGSVIVNP